MNIFLKRCILYACTEKMIVQIFLRFKPKKIRFSTPRFLFRFSAVFFSSHIILCCVPPPPPSLPSAHNSFFSSYIILTYILSNRNSNIVMSARRRRTRRNSTAMIARMPSRKVIMASRRISKHQVDQMDEFKKKIAFNNNTLTRYAKKSFLPFLPCLLLHHLTERVNKKEDALSPFIRSHWSSILCVDISGFTRLSSVLGAEKLKMHCNLYFSNILDIIAKYNGDVFKFLGDALFVLWPVDPDASPEQMAKTCAVAAEAACAIMAVGNYDAQDFNPTTHENTNVKLRLHCGLGCGRINFFHVGGQGQYVFIYVFVCSQQRFLSTSITLIFFCVCCFT